MIYATIATTKGHPIFAECRKSLLQITDKIIETKDFPNWNRWNWREHLLRMLDDHKPEIVIQLDQDERFEDVQKFLRELEVFRGSEAKMMFFGYRMVGNNWYPPNYPTWAHCKVYKWEEGLTFTPYAGLAQPTQLAKARRYYAKVRLLHYCFYTKPMYKKKMKQIEKEYQAHEHGIK